MDVTPIMIEKLLNKLVSPKWDGIVDYDIKIETHDDTGEEYVMVDIIFNIEKYYNHFSLKSINNNFNDPRMYNTSDMDYEITKDVQSALKYLGVKKSYVEVYTIED